MIHPNINLPQLTRELESVGFTARTKLLFRRGFVDILIVNGLVPENIENILSPQEMIAFANPFFRITIEDESGDIQGSFTCPISGFNILEFG